MKSKSLGPGTTHWPFLDDLRDREGEKLKMNSAVRPTKPGMSDNQDFSFGFWSSLYFISIWLKIAHIILVKYI